MPIEEKYLIADRGGATYIGKLGHGFKPSLSIHITIWCVVDCLVQWDLEVEILVVLIGLVHKNEWHESSPINSGKDK